jgi:hypothetical protein
MTDAALNINQRHRTSNLSEMGIVVYNGVQDALEIKSRRGKLGSRKIGEVAHNYPNDLAFTVANRKPAAAGQNFVLYNNGLMPVFTDFTGALDRKEEEYRWAGECRTTNQLQGMPGRELGRVLALKCAGSTTIWWNALLPISARALIMWSIPRSAGLPVNPDEPERRTAELREFRLIDGITRPMKLHELIHNSMSPTLATPTTNDEEVELSNAILFADAVKYIALVGFLACIESHDGALTDTEKEKYSVQFGLITPNESDEDYAEQSKKAADFQRLLIDRVFQARHDPKTKKSHEEDQFLFDDVPLQSMRRAGGDERHKAVNRKGVMAVENMLKSIATLMETKKSRIIGVTLSSALPGQDVDVYYL